MRKQQFELTTVDFEQYPIWEFALDEEDRDNQNEKTVRPVEGLLPLNLETVGYVLVAAWIRLADGTTLPGYLTPNQEGRVTVEDNRPVILLGGNTSIDLWYGIFPPKPEQMAENYRVLSRRPEQVFPLTYVTAIPIRNGPISGLVEGFSYMKRRTDFPAGSRLRDRYENKIAL